MPRHRLQRDVERRRQLGDQQRLLAEPLQDSPPNRVGEREEHPVEQLLARVFDVFDELNRRTSRHAPDIINRTVDSQLND